MTEIFTPRDAADLIECVAQARARGLRCRIRGGGSKREMAGGDDAPVLDLSRLDGVIEYDPAELVLTAHAGTPLSVIETLLADHGQHLPFEPFDHDPLFRLRPH